MDKYNFRRVGKDWVCVTVVTRNHLRPTLVRFTFSHYGFNAMLKNFALGGCAITEKGLFKYSNSAEDVNTVPKWSAAVSDITDQRRRLIDDLAEEYLLGIAKKIGVDLTQLVDGRLERRVVRCTGEEQYLIDGEVVLKLEDGLTNLKVTVPALSDQRRRLMRELKSIQI